jgi:integrase
MGVKIREKPKGSGVWWIFIDHHGMRRAKKIGKDKKMANQIRKKIEAKLVLSEMNVLKRKKPDILFKDYADKWLEGYVATALKHSTYRGYKSIVEVHLKPYFGNKTLKSIDREMIRNFLFRKMNKGKKRMSRSRAEHVKNVLSGIFTQAVEDGHFLANPASRMGRLFKSIDQPEVEEISPLNAQELDHYLETCKEAFPHYFPLFLTYARTGMRLGEALALKWEDINFNGQFIELRRALVEGRLTTPKNGKSRRIDMTPNLVGELQTLKAKRFSQEQTLRVIPFEPKARDLKKKAIKKKAAKKKDTEMSSWVFVTPEGTLIDQGNLRGRIHYKICEKAEIQRIRIHDLRHSYATIRIAAGHNIADVSRQLGHASIKITIDTYYHWVPSGSQGEVAELDILGKEAQKSATYPQPGDLEAEKG